MAGTNQNPRNSPEKIKDGGFSLTEVVITTAIIGTLCSIAYPNYINNLRRSESLEAKASIASIQAVISSYIDETGEIVHRVEEVLDDASEANLRTRIAALLQ